MFFPLCVSLVFVETGLSVPSLFADGMEIVKQFINLQETFVPLLRAHQLVSFRVFNNFLYS